MIRSMASVDRWCRCSVRFEQPDRYRTLLALDDRDKIIAQGAAMSYVAAGFGRRARVVSMRHFDRILGFDERSGLIEVEGGTPVGKVHELLAAKGRYLAVQPGHPDITVGGCIACNVHGKNQQRDGLFDAHVERIRLFHPSHGALTLSRHEEPQLFALTCGGFGLTGIIVSATLRSRQLPARHVEIRQIRVESLADTFATIDDQGRDADFLYTWNDLSRRHCRGRGFVVTGRFIDHANGSAGRVARPAPRRDERRAWPRVWGRGTVPPLNDLYRRLETTLRPVRVVPVEEALYPVARRMFYYDFYGSAGFVEQQMLVPEPGRAEYVAQLLERLHEHRPCVVLSSCKLFQGERRLLNFDGSGVCFNIDVVNDAPGLRFFDALDDLNCQWRALPNLAKDSRLDRASIARLYGAEYERFRTLLRAYDPRRLFVSELSERADL